MKPDEVEQRLRQTFEAAAVLDEVRRSTAVPASNATADLSSRRRWGSRTVRSWLPPLLAVAVVVITAAIAYGIAGPGGSGRPGTPPAGSGGSTQVAEGFGNAPGPLPAFYVAHIRSATGTASPIQVRSTSTGRLLRSLGSVSDPYASNGFVLSPDRSILYYTALDETAQTLEIKAIPVAGGSPSDVVAGVQPQPSPDGQELAYRSEDGRTVSVINLTSRIARTITLSDAELGRRPTDLVWVSSTELIVLATQTTGNSECRPGERCPRQSKVGEAYVVDASGSNLSAHQLPELAGKSLHWSDLTLLAGRALSNIVATDGSSIYLLNPSIGRIISQVAMPNGYVPTSVDATGTRFLLLAADGDLAEWTYPGADTPIGTGISEAAW